MIEVAILCAVAFVMEAIDSGLGMMYGTVLSPVMILLGYDPYVVIPSILVSQALGGFVATLCHNRLGNARFAFDSDDAAIAVVIVMFGVIGVTFGAFVACAIPAIVLKAYIGALCAVMGALVLSNMKFKFSWTKILGVALVSSFNKAMSGGGFGPIVATGQIASGLESKRSIGVTDFAEAPICLASFIVWAMMKDQPSVAVFVPLSAGAMLGGMIGPWLLSRIKSEKLVRMLVGFLALVSGAWVFMRILM